MQFHAAETEAIIDALPDAVYFGTPQGITRCNTRALELLGAYSYAGGLTAAHRRTQRKIPVRYSEHGDDFSSHRSTCPLSVRWAGRWPVLNTWATKAATGEHVLIRGNAAPVRVGDQVIGAVAVNIDITDRYRLQAMVQRQAAELEATFAES